jgi:hypothetical protein
MKKCFAVFLAFLILTSSSLSLQGLQVVVKASAFFHHFIHHLTCEEERVGVLDFVKMHYSDLDLHEADHPAEHEKLPFHNDRNSPQNIAQQTPFLLIEPNLVASLPKLDFVSALLNARPRQWLSSLHSGDIWQPPKAA